MTTDTKTEHWQKVRDALERAVSFTWDECHKIYIAMDRGEHEEMEAMGYEMTLTSDVDTDLATIQQWFSDACALRFISAVRTVTGDPNEGFDQLIKQFEYDDEEVICILTGADGENADDCTTHSHEEDE